MLLMGMYSWRHVFLSGDSLLEVARNAPIDPKHLRMDHGTLLCQPYTQGPCAEDGEVGWLRLGCVGMSWLHLGRVGF